MKRKLRLLILTMLFTVSYTHAQTTDVWDFGATQLSGNYNNKLDVGTINGWYATTITAGTKTNTLPNFTVGNLTWVGNPTSDRLRTTNTALTRYDETVATSAAGYVGRVYCNGTTTGTNRYFNLTLAEDDEVTIVCRADAAGGVLGVSNTTTNKQIDTYSFSITESSSSVSEVKFAAKEAGVFKIYCTAGKGSFYRILRKPATYTTITGVVDETAASGISGYSVVFTNAAGKTWTAPVTSGAYNVTLPTGYTYQMSLLNGNGYIISNGNSLAVTDTTTSYNVVVLKLDLFTVTGAISGLGTDISKVALVYSPDPLANKIFVPKPVINTVTGAYTVELEPNVGYTISGQGVNDYSIPLNKITITSAVSSNVAFTAKPVYPITINTTGLNGTQIGKLTLTFTNLNESGYVYSFPSISGITLRDGIYTVTYGGLAGEPVELKLISNLEVNGATASKDLNFRAIEDASAIPYVAEITVGTDKDYQTINAALKAVARMTRPANERVIIKIDPGNYEEMILINKANITLKNAASTPSIALKDAGVRIDANAVRITSYYGLGYNYYSQGTDNKWSADALAVNTENKYQLYNNVSGTTNDSFWNATAVIKANGFEAENIIFENSYNQYISQKESDDTLVLVAGNKGLRPKDVGNTAVQSKSFVERAAAIGIANGTDKVVLNNCRVVGRQDSFFGGTGSRVVVNKGVVMGATDFIFGGMIAVFYQVDLAMNTSADPNDVSYITAPQQSSGRGYLMYECKITSAVPNVETVSTTVSKPGYFGRPWAGTTGEAVFYNTTIENSSIPGQSLILPIGWNSSLSGTSDNVVEFGSVDALGVPVDVSGRATWSYMPTQPLLRNGLLMKPENFTSLGSDPWNPIPVSPVLGTEKHQETSSVAVYGYKNNVAVSNVKSNTTVLVYGLNGALVKSFDTDTDINFNLNAGVWIVVVKAADGQKVVKVMTY